MCVKKCWWGCAYSQLQTFTVSICWPIWQSNDEYHHSPVINIMTICWLSFTEWHWIWMIIYFFSFVNKRNVNAQKVGEWDNSTSMDCFGCFISFSCDFERVARDDVLSFPKALALVPWTRVVFVAVVLVPTSPETLVLAPLEAVPLLEGLLLSAVTDWGRGLVGLVGDLAWVIRSDTKSKWSLLSAVTFLSESGFDVGISFFVFSDFLSLFRDKCISLVGTNFLCLSRDIVEPAPISGCTAGGSLTLPRVPYCLLLAAAVFVLLPFFSRRSPRSILLWSSTSCGAP